MGFDCIIADDMGFDCIIIPCSKVGLGCIIKDGEGIEGAFGIVGLITFGIDIDIGLGAAILPIDVARNKFKRAADSFGVILFKSEGMNGAILSVDGKPSCI